MCHNGKLAENWILFKESCNSYTIETELKKKLRQASHHRNLVLDRGKYQIGPALYLGSQLNSCSTVQAKRMKTSMTN